MTKYIAKSNTWFKEGVEAELISSDYGGFGLFRGIRINNGERAGLDTSEEYVDEELCAFDEFKIIEE